jgi:hypothetical protein
MKKKPEAESLVILYFIVGYLFSEIFEKEHEPAVSETALIQFQVQVGGKFLSNCL